MSYEWQIMQLVSKVTSSGRIKQAEQSKVRMRYELSTIIMMKPSNNQIHFCIYWGAIPFLAVTNPSLADTITS